MDLIYGYSKASINSQLIILIHNPPRSRFTPAELDQLLPHRRPAILAIDVNNKLVDWGYNLTNTAMFRRDHMFLLLYLLLLLMFHEICSTILSFLILGHTGDWYSGISGPLPATLWEEAPKDDPGFLGTGLRFNVSLIKFNGFYRNNSIVRWKDILDAEDNSHSLWHLARTLRSEKPVHRPLVG
ncbi:hypothetical protein J6590_071220 [Homalodisca vitripennis]|nr:hypothetical protein J6590_071220 [Homalodisca vitripennis]